MLSTCHELSPEEVLMVAIDVEEVNGARLRTFAKRFADASSDAARVLGLMADEEDAHRLQLEEVYTQRYGKVRRTVGDDDVEMAAESRDVAGGTAALAFRAVRILREVAVITAEDLGVALENEGPERDVVEAVGDNPSLSQALETVLAAELRAQDFYRRALRQTADPDLQAAFRQRGGLEGEHLQWMRARLDAQEPV
ncbi:MAG: hypothetical protein QF681_02210 [Vicinamibacterales bacterium]|jgi:rubrerythrin|nr:hypothetical protein [Vicinamibacterales bacterium]